MLSAAAFNALLKTLEEPPPKSLFVFCTTDPDKIPETVQSRCQRYDLRRIPTAEVAARLRAIADAEKITVSEASLLAVARAGDGSLRDALTLLDQLVAHGGGAVDDAQVAEVLDLIDRALLTAIARALHRGRRGGRARGLPARVGARRRSEAARRGAAGKLPGPRGAAHRARPRARGRRGRRDRRARRSWPGAPTRRACAACSARCCASRKTWPGRPTRSPCSRWPWCAAPRSRPATRWRSCSRASMASSGGSPAAAGSRAEAGTASRAKPGAQRRRSRSGVEDEPGGARGGPATRRDRSCATPRRPRRRARPPPSPSAARWSEPGRLDLAPPLARGVRSPAQLRAGGQSRPVRRARGRSARGAHRARRSVWPCPR